MRVPPPATISPQAQALLRDAPEITPRSMELSAIQERRQSAAFYVPDNLTLALGLGVTLAEEMIVSHTTPCPVASRWIACMLPVS